MKRCLVLTVALAYLCVAATASTASASIKPATCLNFDTVLLTAGPGDTIVLSGLCTDPPLSHTLPSVANLTIEGASTGTNGFDGTGASGPALTGSGTSGLTLSNLTFENYPTTAVSISTTNITDPFSFTGDTFVNNQRTATGNGGGLALSMFSGLACPTPAPSITVSDSAFIGNSAPGQGGIVEAEGGGGGALLGLACLAGGSKPKVTVIGSIFSGNSVIAPSGQSRQGGGLWVGSATGLSNAMPIGLTQTRNLFNGNSVNGSGGSYAGGGEFTVGADLTSSGDRFTGNSLSGPATSTVSSEGAGLSTRAGGGCATGNPMDTSTAINLVSAGNSIEPPTGMSSGGEGAGIYAGCSIGTGGYHLTLVNSTVSGNQDNGDGVAGIDGEATDTLTLRNTIVKGNAGGEDLDGFGASPGANVTAANSDVCAIGAGTPFAGAGNICANPLLANAGAGDAHETSASPTIDVGSNSFVGSTTTDVFGAPRIVPGRPGDAAIVDIGAAEFQLPPANPQPPSNSFTLGKLKGKTLFVDVASPGTVDVTQAGVGGSSATAAAKKLLNTSSASGGPGTIAVALRLTKKARKRLSEKGKVKLSATVTFTPTGGNANSQPAKLKIRKKTKK